MKKWRGSTFWQNLIKRSKQQRLLRIGQKKTKKKKNPHSKASAPRTGSSNNSGSRKDDRRHLTVDQLVAKRRLKQLHQITRADLAVLSAAEPYRVSSCVILQRNLLDSALYLNVIVVYLLCRILTHNNRLSFAILFFFLFSIINRHIESYRSYVLVGKSVQRLEQDRELMDKFLSTHLDNGASLLRGRNRRLRQQQQQQQQEKGPVDSFVWINRVIIFFWPYLSELIHPKLDEFFQSGSSMTRAIISDVLVIEKCQLGHQTPRVKQLTVLDSKEAATKSLVYNINLVYNGDMLISILYRYLCCCTSRIGLKDVFLHFKLQVTLGPLPNIEEITFTLLELPDFGYKGIALAELAELRMIRKLINRIIKDHLLYPRKVTVNLHEMSESLGRRKAAGAAPKQAAKTPSLPAAAASESASTNQRVGFWKRIQADALICSCMSANFLLRCCQCFEQRGHRNRSAASRSSRSPQEQTRSIKATTSPSRSKH